MSVMKQKVLKLKHQMGAKSVKIQSGVGNNNKSPQVESAGKEERDVLLVRATDWLRTQYFDLIG